MMLPKQRQPSQGESSHSIQHLIVIQTHMSGKASPVYSGQHISIIKRLFSGYSQTDVKSADTCV